ncbi:hypothetical protein BKA66DRAFT_192463 [Pyrenochaeta sp. MPI-SDFR-AT-0127]|nr:hypothetical protein BKA66DRAFT_192463 [Pyrenochaeta sp. MPI-SDFR-AT-0127]
MRLWRDPRVLRNGYRTRFFNDASRTGHSSCSVSGSSARLAYANIRFEQFARRRDTESPNHGDANESSRAKVCTKVQNVSANADLPVSRASPEFAGWSRDRHERTNIPKATAPCLALQATPDFGRVFLVCADGQKRQPPDWTYTPQASRESGRNAICLLGCGVPVSPI